MSLFSGGDGLKSGWRSAIGLGAVAIAIVASSLVSSAIFGSSARVEASPARLAGTMVLLAASVLAASRVLVKRLDHASLTSLGFGGGPRLAALELAKGAALGGALFTLALVPLFVTSHATFSLRPAQAMGLGLGVVAFFFSALVEELALRGYSLQHAARALGPMPATVLFALLFGLAHAGNPGFSRLGFANVALAGVLLSFLLFRSGRLWLSIGMHWAWNVVQGLVFGVSVSGTTNESSLPSVWSTNLSGPSWLTGGTFGLEGSVPALVVLLIASAALFPRSPRLPEATSR